MRVSEFDFDLPEHLIALHPAEPRDSARLLVVDPVKGLSDRHIPDLKALLPPAEAWIRQKTGRDLLRETVESVPGVGALLAGR